MNLTSFSELPRATLELTRVISNKIIRSAHADETRLLLFGICRLQNLQM